MKEKERKIVKYFRYFQGDVKLASYENHGTDVYVYLHALAGESVEWLPIWSDTGQWPAVGRTHDNMRTVLFPWVLTVRCFSQREGGGHQLRPQRLGEQQLGNQRPVPDQILHIQIVS